jgi:hypothetical protein
MHLCKHTINIISGYKIGPKQAHLALNQLLKENRHGNIRFKAAVHALRFAKWHKAQAPAGETTVVFRDSAFSDDVAKTNLTAILHQYGLDNVRSL